jgi:hypothetical protein
MHLTGYLSLRQSLIEMTGTESREGFLGYEMDSGTDAHPGHAE